jgi:hypothetical protein
MAYLSTYKDFIITWKTPHLQLQWQTLFFAIERYYLYLKTTKVEKYK